jgi:hypothetical protein
MRLGPHAIMAEFLGNLTLDLNRMQKLDNASE